MTYRIAYVRFRKSGKAYPVDCERSDLQRGDVVVVRMGAGEPLLRVAEVDRVEFLNWQCQNEIICKRSEFFSRDAGGYTIKREAPPQFLETVEQLEKELQKLGWGKKGFGRNVYRSVFVCMYGNTGAAIGIRRRGIDYQIYDENWEGSLKDGPKGFPSGPRNIVRHNFYASEVDLLEFTKRFAISAHLPIEELKRFFIPVGRKQKPLTLD
ncbi:hypothetical protein [Erythrobacter sp. HI0063]|uniref:hypothetical protein n=1 Tax=Erythrobacter sp. HI0063 TaxID=1822240 RepID=UPI000AB89356|nr:hypothetical protein [Erythrobacter sp. HI0063]